MNNQLRNGSSVKLIQSLVTELKDKVNRIKELEDEIKSLKAKKQELEEVVIPDTMSEIGVNSITLMTNEIVTVKPLYFARLFTDKDPEPFFKWLRVNEFGGLIKEKLEVYPEAWMEEIIDILKNLEVNYEQKSTVHWKTLEAWFKECIEGGMPNLPLDLFSNYVGRKATVK